MQNCRCSFCLSRARIPPTCLSFRAAPPNRDAQDKMTRPKQGTLFRCSPRYLLSFLHPRARARRAMTMTPDMTILCVCTRLARAQRLQNRGTRPGGGGGRRLHFFSLSPPSPGNLFSGRPQGAWRRSRVFTPRFSFLPANVCATVEDKNAPTAAAPRRHDIAPCRRSLRSLPWSLFPPSIERPSIPSRAARAIAKKKATRQRLFVACSRRGQGRGSYSRSSSASTQRWRACLKALAVRVQPLPPAPPPRLLPLFCRRGAKVASCSFACFCVDVGSIQLPCAPCVSERSKHVKTKRPNMGRAPESERATRGRDAPSRPLGVAAVGARQSLRLSNKTVSSSLCRARPAISLRPIDSESIAHAHTHGVCLSLSHTHTHVRRHENNPTLSPSPSHSLFRE
jgi:hypothetical protein